MMPPGSKPRVFGVDYQFLACGDVFTQGLAHAAADLGITYAHADWNAPDLPTRIQLFRPDLLFVVHGRKFSRKYHNLKAFGATTAVWLLDEPYEVDDTRLFSKRFDQVFVNDPATLDRHPGAVPLPVCYDPHVHTSGESDRSYAVGFVGGGNGTRERYLAALARAGLLGYVVGGKWQDPAVNGQCLSGNIPPAETVKLYQQTRIVLNVFREVHHYNRDRIPATAINPRVYEATACGALVVSEWRPEIDAVVPELPTFRTEAECVETVTRFIDNPSARHIQLSMCQDRLKDHTYAARLQTVMETVGSAVGV